MNRIVQKFSSYKAAEAANDAYYRSLTPQQRLDVMLDLIASQRSTDESANQLARVCRIVKRESGLPAIK